MLAYRELGITVFHTPQSLRLQNYYPSHLSSCGNTLILCSLPQALTPFKSAAD